MPAEKFEEILFALRKETTLLLDSKTLSLTLEDAVIEKILSIFPEERLTTTSLSQIVHPDDRDITTEVFKHFLFGDNVTNFRNKLLRKDGSPVSVSWDAKCVDGTWVCLVTDISELIKIENILQSERHRFEAILETVSEVVFVIDLNGRCVFINSASNEVLGIGPSEILWRDLVDVLNLPKEEMRTELATALSFQHATATQAKGLTHSNFARDVEVVHHKPNGDEVVLSINVNDMRGATGEIVGKLGTARDVTMIKRQQSELIQASKMMSLGEMAGGVAHEINNPLAIINGRAGQLKEVLADTPLNLELANEMLTSIEGTTLRIAKIVKGLRTFSRDAENDPFELVHLRLILDDTLAFCRERFKQHGIRLNLESSSNEIVLECRATQVSQALLNLLNNAYDAVENLSEKWVRVEAREAGNRVLIKVVDSGSGIPEKIRNKILQPFFTTKDVGRGTGLGLSISRGIVAAHGGELTIDSEHTNTCFVINLPKRQVSTESHA